MKKWIYLIIFIAIALIIYFSLGLRIIEHGMQLLSFSGVAIIIYYLFSDVIFQFITNPKLLKHKKTACGIFTAIAIVLCIFAYVEINKTSKVVQMQEDVIYIKPKSDTVK